MAILKWTVLVLCTLWAMGGAIVMLGYGAGSSATERALDAVMNFGPFIVSLAWVVATRRSSEKRVR